MKSFSFALLIRV